MCVLSVPLQMPVKELPHKPVHLGIAPTVAAALDDIQRNRHALVAQGLVQQLTLVQRHERVLVAVADQKRRILPRDIRDRVCPAAGVLVLLDGPADELRLRRVGRIVIHPAGERAHLRKIGRAEKVAHRLHTAARRQVFLPQMQ